MGRRPTLKRNYDDEGNLISKECSGCHEIKLTSEFNKTKREIDGLRPRCKECLKKYRQDNAESIREYKKRYRKDNAESIREYHKQYRKNNAEKIKEHRKENAESIREYQKKYRQDNAENIKKHHKKYYQENKEKINENNKKRYQENKEEIKERRRKNYQENKEEIKEYNKKYYQENSDYFKKHHKKYYQENLDYFKEYRQECYSKKTEEVLRRIKTEVKNNPDNYNYIKGKEIYGIIYLVHNVKTNRYYVGQTTIGFDNRYPSGWLYEHGRKKTVREDLELYGENSFEYIKLFKVAHSQYELDKLEAHYIDYYDSYENGYNETRGNIFTNRGKEK